MIFLKKQKGFTLIELLVVIAIIAIFSSVVLASLNSVRAKARDARRLEELHQIRIALELFASDYGKYPAGYWDTWFWISDNNYPGLGLGWPPCPTTGGLWGYLPNVCSFRDPNGNPYAYIGNIDGSPKLGAAFETAQYQIIPYTYGPNNVPVPGWFESK